MIVEILAADGTRLDSMDRLKMDTSSSNVEPGRFLA